MPLDPRQIAIRRGFTLIEMLAALVMVAIVLPVLMQGVTMSMGAAGSVVERLQAAALAESKLTELLATNTWNQPDLEGEFTTDQILAAGGNIAKTSESSSTTSASRSASSSSTGSSPTTGSSAADPSRFKWAAEVKDWLDQRVQQVDVTVTWESRGEQRSLTLSTLVQAQEQ